MFRITRWADFSPMRSRSASCSSGQSVQVGDALHQAPVHQLIDQRLADAVDVHHGRADEVQHRLLQPRRAVGVDAAAGRLAVLAHDVAAADRALLRHAERPAARALLDDADHFRDHVAAALDEHRVADLDAEPLDLVFVVQRGAGDRNAADVNRLQMRHRRERSGAAHLDLDPFDHGGLLARRELEGDGPARRLGGPAELALLRDGIHLGHHAVDLVGQLVAALPPIRRRTRAVRRRSRTGAAWG